MPRELPEDDEVMRHLMNNRPREDFGGLSSNEMHRLLYDTYEAACPLQINSPIADETLDALPFFRLTEIFLEIIQRDGYVKLTPLQALPKKILTELYSHKFIPEYFIETGLYKLSREVDSPVLSALHYNTQLSGLIRKANKKLFLTKVALKLLAENNRTMLFIKALQAYTNKLSWSYFDGYPEMPVGNLGWGYTIFMLMHEGDVPREPTYYASKYLQAFPEFFETLPKRQYSTPEQDLERCYSLRTFERFLERWGFVSTQDATTGMNTEHRRYIPTPALKAIFRFDN